MLTLKSTGSKMKHVIVPDHKPPKSYACKICTKKCIPGQAVIMDPTGMADKPCCVMHVACIKTLIFSSGPPEIMDGSDKALAKLEKQRQEEERISSEFEELREKYANKIV